MSSRPTSFISYSWDSASHKQWVSDLATRLRQDGVNIMLDKWHAVPGDQLPKFMEEAVSSNDYILIVCTSIYKNKSEERKGGVGYEGDIITAQILSGTSDRKFIPILREGTWEKAAPIWLLGKFYIDMRGNPYEEENYNSLLKTLHGLKPDPPELGDLPLSFAARHIQREPFEPKSMADVLEARKNFHVKVLRFDADQKIGVDFPYSDYVRLKISNNSSYLLPYLTVQTIRYNRNGKRIGSSRKPSINTSNIMPGESFEVDYYPKGHLPGVQRIEVEIEHIIGEDSMQFFKEFEPFL